MPNPIDNQTPLPKELRSQIEKFRKKLWRIKITEAFLAGIFGLLFSFVLLFVAERFTPIPTWLRGLNLILGFSIFFIFAPLWINRWVFRHRKENQLAKLISEKFPHLGDRLLGVIELEDQDSKKENVSPELRAAAMRTVAQEAKQRDFNQALPGTWSKRWIIGLSSCALITLISFFFMPSEGMLSSLKRWLSPWSSTERFTFTKINDDQYKDGYIVPLNEDFSLNLSLREGSAKHPSGQAKFKSDEWLREDFIGDLLSFKFKGKTQQGDINVKIGDATTKIKLIPTARPTLKSTFTRINLPSYLARKEPEFLELSGKSIQVLKGSEVTFHSKSNRDISSSSLSPLFVESDITQPGEDESFEVSKTPLTSSINGDEIITGPILVSEKIQKFSLTWTDTHDLATKRPTHYRIDPLTDEAPSTYLETDKSEFQILLSETFSFHVSNSDDFGIQRAGIHWQGLLFSPGIATPAKGDNTLYFPAKEEPKQLNFSQEYIFNPKALNIITPQRLTIKTWVKDQFPDRGRIFSEQTITVDLLTVDMMKEVNNQKLEKLGEQLNALIEDAAEIEEETSNLNHILKQVNKDALSSDPQKKQQALERKKEIENKLEDLKNREEENNEKLKELTKESKSLFNDAAQKRTMEKKALKELFKMNNNLEKAAEKKQQAQQDMQDAQEQMQQAESQSDQKSQQSLESANEKQKEALKKMQQAAKQAKASAEQGEQATFVNRLKRAATEQLAVKETIIEESQKSISQSEDYHPFGKSFEQIIPSQKKAFASGYKLQKKVRLDIEYLIAELIEYQNRTQKEQYLKIISALEKGEVNKNQDAILGKLKRTQWFRASNQAERLSDQLNQFAKLLEQAGQKGGGGGGGGAEDSLNDEDFDFMLRVMQMVKNEQDIREKTRSMDQLSRTYEAQNPSK